MRTELISSAISASFTLQLHNGSRDINLALHDSEMLIADLGYESSN